MNDTNPAPDQQRELSPDERNWGMFCHLAGFAGIIIPFGSIIGPLIIWLVKRDEMPFVNYNGKEALNFQITVMIGFVGAWVLMFVLIGALLMPLLLIANLVFCILAAVAVSKGEHYRYPFAIRLLK